MTILKMTGLEILGDIKHKVLDKVEFTTADMLKETEKLVSMDTNEVTREQALDIMYIYNVIRDCRDRKISGTNALNVIVEIISKYKF